MRKFSQFNSTLLLTLLGLGVWLTFVLKRTDIMLVLLAAVLFIIIQQLHGFNQRIQQLESSLKIQPSSNVNGICQLLMACGFFIGVGGSYVEEPNIVWGGIALTLASLIVLLNHFHTRLALIEQQKVKNSSYFSNAEAPEPTQSHFEPSELTQKIQPQPEKTHQTVTTEKAWWQPIIDWCMHGNPILRVAIALLMVGVVLLLRFASENWQLSLGIKLLAIAIMGGAVSSLGFYLRKKNSLFAVALQGAGLAVIFLTLTFAHQFGVIASLMLASVCCAAVLIVTVALSLRQNAVYLAMLALTMAYVAPLVIPQSHPESLFLFSYYLLINVAVAALNFVRPWKILNQIAFFATGFIAGGYIVVHAQQSEYFILDGILWLHLTLFIWLSVRYSQLMVKEYASINLKEKHSLPPLLDVGLIFSVPIFGFSLHAFLMQQSSLGLTLGAMALGLIYSALGFWIRQRQSNLSLLAKSFFILAAAFIALIVPLYKGAHWTAVGWVAQGTALLVWGISERERISRYIGVCLVLLSSVALFYQFWSSDSFPVLSTTIYACAQFICAYYLFKFQQSRQDIKILPTVFLMMALYAGATACVQMFDWHAQGYSPYVASASLFLLIFSAFLNYRARVSLGEATLIIATVLLGFAWADVTQQNLFSAFYWLGTVQHVAFGVAMVCLSAVLIVNVKKLTTNLSRLWWGGLLWLSLAALGNVFWSASYGLSLAICPVLYSGYLIWQRQYMLLGQASVWFITATWLVWVNLSSATLFAYILPIFNPVDVLSLLVLVGLLWLVYQSSFTVHEFGKEWLYKVAVILIGLFVLSSIVVRALHVYLNTPLWSLAIWSNGSVQLSLTLLWVVLAFVLMLFSSQRHYRQLWFIGATLLAIVVIKLIGLDLAQTGTLTRVISFIGAGGVMLLIAYLAPLPPEQNSKHLD